ncbi:MAG: hypothetical protein AAF497_11285, partial [Planctomycetota bacterium]
MTFDPYLKWLGIRDSTRPVSHYRLLGIEDYESDVDVISLAADRQMGHVRRFQNSEHSADSQRILNEIAAAKVSLLDDVSRHEYDRQLRTLRSQAAAEGNSSALARLLPAALILLVCGTVLAVGYVLVIDRWPQESEVNPGPGSSTETAVKSATSPGPTAGSPTREDSTPPIRRIPDSTVSPWVKPEAAATLVHFNSPFLESLANRSFEPANELIDDAQFRTQYLNEQLNQLQRVANDSQQFWTAVQSGIQAAEPGKVLAYRHQPVEVVRKSADELKLVAGDGSECSFQLDQGTIEFDLAISLARPFLPPDSRKAEGIIATVRNLDQRNKSSFPVLNAVIAENNPKDSQEVIETTPATTVDTPEPVSPTTAIVEQPASPRVDEPEDDRLPIPLKLERDKAKTLVRLKLAGLKEEYPAEMIARKLFESAGQTVNLALKYELLSASRTHGFSSSDLPSALQATTEMYRQFRVDTVELVKESITDGARRFNRNELPQLVAYGSSHVRKAIVEDDFDGARDLARTLVGLARRMKDGDLSRTIRELRDSISVIEQHYFEAQEHLAILAEDGENRESNGFVGLFLVADKGDLESARPYLARSGVARLEELARSPRSVQQRMRTADTWWELAAEFDDHRRVNLRNRAVSIYRTIFPQVSGFQKSKIRQKVTESLTIDPLLAVLTSQVWRVEWEGDQP